MKLFPGKERPAGTLSGTLKDDVNTFKQLFCAPANNDFISRSFSTCGFDVCLIYIEGMSGNDTISEGVMEPCLAAATVSLSAKDRADYLDRSVLNIADTKQSDMLNELTNAVLDGKSVLLIDGCKQALMLETRDYEKRAVSRPQSESVLIGPQQGYVENLRTNLTLLHRLIKSPKLVCESQSVGRQIPTRLSLVYLAGAVNEDALKEVRRRIGSLNLDYIPDSGHLMALIEDSSFLMIPQIMQTERPDRTADCICDGQIAIMMDNSPYALIAPITLYHLMHAADDVFYRWQYACFTRIMRLAGVLISLLLPGIYIALTTFHAHMIPLDLLTSIAETRAKVPFPILVEILIMELSFYLINEAGARMPSQIGSALGIVGALILGQAAVAANIISPILIIIVALTGLGNYVTPIYGVGLAVLILRLGVLFAAAALGFYGVVLIMLVYLCVLANARSMGFPMLAPFAPHRPHNPDLLLRLPLWMQKRLFYVVNNQSWLKRKPKENEPVRGWKGDGQ